MTLRARVLALKPVLGAEVTFGLGSVTSSLPPPANIASRQISAIVILTPWTDICYAIFLSADACDAILLKRLSDRTIRTVHRRIDEWRFNCCR